LSGHNTKDETKKIEKTEPAKVSIGDGEEVVKEDRPTTRIDCEYGEVPNE